MQLNLNTLEPASEDAVGQPSKPAPGAVVAAEMPGVRAFNIWGLRVRHLVSKEDGWGHDEGDSTSRTIFEISNIYENGRRSAVRIIVGRHSIWVFF